MKFGWTTHSIKIICAATVALFAAVNSSANAIEDPAQLVQDTPIRAEMAATIAALADGEAKGFNRLVGGSTFSDLSKFPQWRGFKGSHAAGLFQDEPSTWAAITKANPDIKSFGAKSQIEGNVYWVQKIYADATAGCSYAADLEAKMLDRRGMAALRQQWPGGFNAGFWGRYEKALPEVLSASTPLPAALSGCSGSRRCHSCWFGRRAGRHLFCQ